MRYILYNSKIEKESIMVNKTEENNQNFSDYLGEFSSLWHFATLNEKDYQLHDFLNIECGAGVFTHQVNGTDIRIEYDAAIQVIINTTQPLETIDFQINSFLSTLDSI